MGVARTGRTNDPFLSNIFIAQRINRLSGGAVIAAWEVDQLPDDVLDVFAGLANDLPVYQKDMQDTEKTFEGFRKRNKYRER